MIQLLISSIRVNSSSVSLIVTFDVRYTSTGNDPFARDGIGEQDIVYVCENIRSHFDHGMRASCYVFSIVGNSLFPDKSGMSIVNYKFWPIVKNLKHCSKTL